jgi:hypothetical protein
MKNIFVLLDSLFWNGMFIIQGYEYRCIRKLLFIIIILHSM